MTFPILPSEKQLGEQDRTHTYFLKKLDEVVEIAPATEPVVKKLRTLWRQRTHQVVRFARIAAERQRGRTMSVRRYMQLHAKVFTMRMACVKTSGEIFQQEMERLDELQTRGRWVLDHGEIAKKTQIRIAFLCVCETIHRLTGLRIEQILEQPQPLTPTGEESALLAGLMQSNGVVTG